MKMVCGIVVYPHVIIHPPLSLSLLQGEKARPWTIEFNIQDDSAWANPLMGWNSGDSVHGSLRDKLKFNSKEEAIGYAGACNTCLSFSRSLCVCVLCFVGGCSFTLYVRILNTQRSKASTTRCTSPT
jgi:hypothetical protein